MKNRNIGEILIIKEREMNEEYKNPMLDIPSDTLLRYPVSKSLGRIQQKSYDIRRIHPSPCSTPDINYKFASLEFH